MVVHFRPDSTLLSVNHQGQFPSVTLSFNLAPGVALGQAVTAIRRAQLEIGLPASVSASFQGTAQAFAESLASEPLLILAALFAVYIVLGVLYESYVHPLTILSTLPSAGVGALLALMLFRIELSIIALIGIILLIGIVKKNGIMMVDFALEAERSQGLSAREAIHGACLVRFRPILMTTMAAILGATAARVGPGLRLGAPPTAGHRHRGWAAPLPAPHALHHSRRLPGAGSADAKARTGRFARASRRAPRRRERTPVLAGPSFTLSVGSSRSPSGLPPGPEGRSVSWPGKKGSPTWMDDFLPWGRPARLRSCETG